MMENCEKLVENGWKKNVQKCEKVSFTQKIEKSTKVLRNLIDILYTNKRYNSSLLRISFTHFTQSSTITTTIY